MIWETAAAVGKNVWQVAWKPVKWVANAAVGHLKKRLAGSPTIDVPKRTFIVMASPTSPEPLWWRSATIDGEEAMEVHCQFQVTNITKSLGIRVSALKITRPRGKTIRPSVIVSNSRDGPFSPATIIPKGVIGWAQCTAWITPRTQAIGEVLTIDLELYDQFNNKHPLKGLSLKGF